MEADEVHAMMVLETYARERGYLVQDSEAGWHYVYKRGKPFWLAECLSHWDAVCLAYDLARGIPRAQPQMARPL